MQDVVKKLKKMKNRKRVKGQIFSNSYGNLNDLEPGEVFEGGYVVNDHEQALVTDVPESDNAYTEAPLESECPSSAEEQESSDVGSEQDISVAGCTDTSEEKQETDATLIDIDGPAVAAPNEYDELEEDNQVIITPYGREVGTMTSPIESEQVHCNLSRHRRMFSSLPCLDELTIDVGPEQHGAALDVTSNWRLWKEAIALFLHDKYGRQDEGENTEGGNAPCAPQCHLSDAGSSEEIIDSKDEEKILVNIEDEIVVKKVADAAETQNVTNDSAESENVTGDASVIEHSAESFTKTEDLAEDTTKIKNIIVDASAPENTEGAGRCDKQITISGECTNINITIKSCCGCSEGKKLESDKVEIEMGRFLLEQKRLRIEKDILKMLKEMTHDDS